MPTIHSTPFDDLVIESSDCKITRILSVMSESTTISLLDNKLLHFIGNELDVSLSGCTSKGSEPIQVLRKLLMKWKAREIDQAKLTSFINILQKIELNEMAGKLTQEFRSQESTVACRTNQPQLGQKYSLPRSSVHNTESPNMDIPSKNFEATERENDTDLNIKEQDSLLPKTEEVQDKSSSSQTPETIVKLPAELLPRGNGHKKMITLLALFLIAVIAICLGLGYFYFVLDKTPDSSSPRSKNFDLHCSKELYSRPVVPIYANSQLNYSESIKAIPVNQKQVSMSLCINDSDHWSPTAELLRDKEITEIHIYDLFCPEIILSLLSKTSCVKKLSFVLRLETFKKQGHLKYQNVSLTNLESLIVNGTESDTSTNIYGVLANNVKMEYLTNFTLANTTINDENLYYIKHILNDSRNLQYFEFSGINLAKEPFYNITSPAMNVKYMAWNQYFGDSRKIDDNILQLNPYFCDRFPNIESFVSEEGYLYYEDRFNLFRCKNITKLRVKMQISTDDTTHIDDIGITSRLANLKRLKLYLQFRDNKCPTFEKINAMGLQNLIDNYSIVTLNIKSNCPLSTEWSSYNRG